MSLSNSKGNNMSQMNQQLPQAQYHSQGQNAAGLGCLGTTTTSGWGQTLGGGVTYYPASGQTISNSPYWVSQIYGEPVCPCGTPEKVACQCVHCHKYLCFGCFLLHYTDEHVNLKPEVSEDEHPSTEQLEDTVCVG